MVNCAHARNDARDYVQHRWATLLTPPIFNAICKHVNDFAQSNNPEDYEKAIAIIMSYGYTKEQAEELLSYGFPTIIGRPPGSDW